MKYTFGLSFVFFAAWLLACEASAEDEWSRAPKVLQVANAWHTGNPLPPELRRFRQSEGDLPGPMDSSALISRVDNPSLLATLVVDSGVDLECREDALSRGLEAAGPTRFFNLLRSQIPVAASMNSDPWIREIRDRMSRPHVVVDALFISYNDMPRQKALAVIARITDDLRRRVPWAKVYSQYSEEFGYKTGTRTKIGNLGHLVVFPDPALGSGHYVNIQPGIVQFQGKPLPRRLWRLAYFDPAHVPALLKASAGDVISLASDLYSENVLYQVQEIYAGDATRQPP